MMRVLVVYESMFGNTREVARAVAAGIGTRLPVELVEVGDAPAVVPPDVALLVVGAPTHAHGLSTPESRADSARRAGERLVSRGLGLREWLDGLRPAVGQPPAAAFDTRIKGPGFLWGSSAKLAEKRLRELGYHTLRSPRSFLVEGPTGPLFDRLVPGQLDEARAWGEALVAEVRVPAAVR